MNEELERKIIAEMIDNPLDLKYVEYQTEKICLTAVTLYGFMLKYVKNQTQEICKAAVKNNGSSLQYVKDQTEELCLMSVCNRGLNLQYVKDQTEEICLAAVKNHGSALQYVKDQTEEICLEAVRQNATALQYVKHQTEEMCLEAVKQNKFYINHVKKENMTVNVIKELKDIKLALSRLDFRTKENCLTTLNLMIDDAVDKTLRSNILTKIIKRFHKDKKIVDFYTKHKLWKHVKFNELKDLDVCSFCMVL